MSWEGDQPGSLRFGLDPMMAYASDTRNGHSGTYIHTYIYKILFLWNCLLLVISFNVKRVWCSVSLL